MERFRRASASFSVRLAASLSLLLLLCLACLGEVDGERATTGECPPGETCSAATPSGLTFVGHAFYDEETIRLGPVLAGGTFDLGLRGADGDEVPAFAFDVQDGAVLEARRGEGIFGPTTAEGEPLYPVDGHLTLTGTGSGTTNVRIVDPENGELFDRLALDVVEVDRVEVVLAQDAERDYVYAGCEDMVAVRLYGSNGSEEVRGFDQSFAMRTDVGTLSEEPRLWDCVILDVPEGSAEVHLEVDVAGGTYAHTFATATLEDDGLTSCPEIRRD